jgi:hypothetical protein
LPQNQQAGIQEQIVARPAQFGAKYQAMGPRIRAITDGVEVSHSEKRLSIAAGSLERFHTLEAAPLNMDWAKKFASIYQHFEVVSLRARYVPTRGKTDGGAEVIIAPYYNPEDPANQMLGQSKGSRQWIENLGGRQAVAEWMVGAVGFAASALTRTIFRTFGFINLMNGNPTGRTFGGDPNEVPGYIVAHITADTSLSGVQLRELGVLYFDYTFRFTQSRGSTPMQVMFQSDSSDRSDLGLNGASVKMVGALGMIKPVATSTVEFRSGGTYMVVSNVNGTDVVLDPADDTIADRFGSDVTSDSIVNIWDLSSEAIVSSATPASVSLYGNGSDSTAQNLTYFINVQEGDRLSFAALVSGTLISTTILIMSCDYPALIRK